MHKHLQLAKSFGEQHIYDEYLEHHVCAIIVKGGAILSVGYNKSGTNAFVRHYQKVAKHEYCETTHAEQDAILKVRSKTDLRGSKIFVVRLRAPNSPLGELGMARPCPICQGVLKSYGIKRAYFSINDNEYGVLSLC
jgi:tRNA(Arg) A34 adenosine deaminase TadA